LKRFFVFGLERTDWLSVRATDGDEWNGRDWSKCVLRVVGYRGKVGLHNGDIRGKIRSVENINIVYMSRSNLFIAVITLMLALK
jgi:hypothetical protein